MADDDWMRAGHWTSDNEMTPEEEAADRRFLDRLVADSPGPAYLWRTEVAITLPSGRAWRWHSDDPLSDPDLPPLPPPQ